jgi:hypothetical protein
MIWICGEAYALLLRNIRRARPRFTSDTGPPHPLQYHHAHWVQMKEIINRSPTHPKNLGEEPISAGTQVNMKNNAYFHFTQSIIYLCSVITACLWDSLDVDAHTSKACSTMRTLRELFSSIKLKLYPPPPQKQVLWALLESDLRKLEVFWKEKEKR